MAELAGMQGHRASRWWLVAPVIGMVSVSITNALKATTVLVPLLGLLGCYSLAQRRRIRVGTPVVAWLVFVGAIATASLLAVLGDSPGIGLQTPLQQTIIGVLLALAVLTIANAVDDWGSDRFHERLSRAGAVVVVLSIGLFLAHLAGIPLPRTGRGELLGVTSQFGNRDVILERPSGLFAEPAQFGSFCSILFVAGLGSRAVPDHRRRLLLAGTLVSLSLSALVILLAGVAATPRRRVVVRQVLALGNPWALVIVPVIVIGLGTTVYTARDAIVFFGRDKAEEALSDSSASDNARVAGSIASAGHGLRHDPVRGSGLGALGVVIFDVEDVPESFDYNRGTYSWSIPLLIVGSTGILGLAGWAAVVVAVGRAGPSLLVPFLAWSLTTSEFLDGSMVTWLVLASVPAAGVATQRGDGRGVPDRGRTPTLA